MPLSVGLRNLSYLSSVYCYFVSDRQLRKIEYPDIHSRPFQKQDQRGIFLQSLFLEIGSAYDPLEVWSLTPENWGIRIESGDRRPLTLIAL